MTGRNILIGIGIGVVIGALVGLVGGLLDLPVAVRGGLTGALVVVGFSLMRRYSQKSSGDPA
ncbi:MAG TPA: hypothetical protein VLE53_04155 [Gemmatimonadaceae bacterium]|nr:hypothetical protein [Gemmatimonadaceae bacterium]